MDIDLSEYMDAYIDGCRENLDLMDKMLLALEQNPTETESVNDIFRAAHTLKGMSATMGFEKIAHFTHEMENILDKIRNNTLPVTTEVIDVLFESFDVLRTLVNDSIDATESEVDLDGIVAKLNGLSAEKAQPEQSQTSSSNSSVATESKTENKADSSRSKKEINQTTEANEAVTADLMSMELTDIEMLSLEEVIDSDGNAAIFTINLIPDCLLKSARVYMIIRSFEEDYSCKVVRTVPSMKDLEEENFDTSFKVLIQSKSDLKEMCNDISQVSEVESASYVDLKPIFANIVSERLKKDYPDLPTFEEPSHSQTQPQMQQPASTSVQPNNSSPVPAQQPANAQQNPYGMPPSGMMPPMYGMPQQGMPDMAAQQGQQPNMYGMPPMWYGMPPMWYGMMPQQGQQPNMYGMPPAGTMPQQGQQPNMYGMPPMGMMPQQGQQPNMYGMPPMYGMPQQGKQPNMYGMPSMGIPQSQADQEVEDAKNESKNADTHPNKQDTTGEATINPAVSNAIAAAKKDSEDDTVKEIVEQIQFVTFTMAGEVYALEIQNVETIINVIAITRVPKAPSYIDGVINLRGEIIPVINTKRRLRLKESETKPTDQIIILDFSEEKVKAGFLVDSVQEVTSLAESAIEPPNRVSESVDIEYLRGVGKVGGKIIILLNAHRIVFDKPKKETDK